MMTSEAGAPVTLPFKRDFEWTPNGRTYDYLDPAGGEVAIQDPRAIVVSSAVAEKYYPVHAGKCWRVCLVADTDSGPYCAGVARFAGELEFLFCRRRGSWREAPCIADAIR